MKSIISNFPITGDEYDRLMVQFDKYCYYIGWQLKKNNTKNNSTDDLEDIQQQLRFAVIKAASYYKRQTYIEASIAALRHKIGDDFIRKMLKVLEKLWDARTRHGANRQKFGDFQEVILDRLLKKYVSKKDRPDKQAPLMMDAKFIRYCKQIAWNEQRALGKKITREKPLRVGLASISEFDYLAREL